MSIEPNGQQSRSDLAQTLRKLRKAAGLSGERLAARCAMSQSKVSRIESGKILPTVLDVDRILTALEVPAEAATELLALTRRANVEYTSWRSIAEIGTWRKQLDLKASEESATEARHFLPATPSGLLHVPDYARETLSPKVSGAARRDVEKAVRARLERQTVLEDVGRSFSFLLTEQAVRWRTASRKVMAEQCEHMAKLSERNNIEISVIPHSVEVLYPPMASFTVIDDRIAIVELFSGEVVLRDPKDVTYHRNLFDFFLDKALKGSRATAFLLAARDEFS